MNPSQKGDRTYDITTPSPENPASSIAVTLAEPTVKAEGLSLTTWGSAFVLSNLLTTLRYKHDLDPFTRLSDRPAPNIAREATETSNSNRSTFRNDSPASATDAGVLRDTDRSCHDQPIPAHGIEILELGAGTGLTGITASAIYAREVVLTDLDPLIPALNDNIRLNSDILHQGTGRAGSLDWNVPTTLSLFPRPCKQGGLGPVAGTDGATSISVTEGESQKPNVAVQVQNTPQNKAHLILAADTMYTSDHPLLLSGAIAAWLHSSPEARAVVCYPLRVAYLDEIREFWTRMEEVGLKCVAEGRKEVDVKEWDDERVNEWSIWAWA